jgi:protein-disulfide isomerase
VYHELQRHAADRKGQLFDRRRVAPPPVGAPVRAKGGKVVAQLFLDPSEQACQRLLDSMQAIAQQVSGQVSFAWRFAPSDDGSEELAGWAILQAEAHRQRGDDALWAIHDTLCRHRLALAHDDLLGYARAARLDVAELEKALVDHRFDALFERDARTKTDAGIDPRAALVVGDYVVDASKPTWAAVLAARMAIENANRP